MKFRKIFLIGSVLLAGSSGIAAQGKGRMGRGMGACHADRMKFCKDIQPGGGEMYQCLNQHENELSQACKEHRAAMHSEMSSAHQACMGDISKFCKDVEPGRGRMRACLKKHVKDLTPECRDAHKNLK